MYLSSFYFISKSTINCQRCLMLNIAHTFIVILIFCPHVFKEANEQYLDKMHSQILTLVV